MKALDEFPRYKTSKRGRCKVCQYVYQKEYSARYRATHKEEISEYHRIKNHRERYEVLQAYAVNGVIACVCCGETTYAFLALDHIDGGGNKHRKEIGEPVGKWCKKHGFPPGFQILCHNCNLAKAYYPECPHQRERESLRYGG